MTLSRPFLLTVIVLLAMWGAAQAIFPVVIPPYQGPTLICDEYGDFHEAPPV